MGEKESGDPSLIIPVQVYQSMQTHVRPVQLQQLLIERVSLLVSRQCFCVALYCLRPHAAFLLHFWKGATLYYSTSIDACTNIAAGVLFRVARSVTLHMYTHIQAYSFFTSLTGNTVKLPCMICSKPLSVCMHSTYSSIYIV